MTVVIQFRDGTRRQLDRDLHVDNVSSEINEARGKGKLLPFANNMTPSRTIHIDPDDVVLVEDNGYSY